MLFLDRLKQAISQSENNDRVSALLIIDIDRFKVINDTFGHGFGDKIIKTIGARIENLCGWNETVCRLGGDEFAFVVPDASDEWEIENRAQAILGAVSRKIDVEGRE